MLVLVMGLLAMVSPVAFGGDLRRFSEVRLRAVWLPVGALLAQIAIIEVVPDGVPVVLDVVHLATYLAAGAFVAANWRIPGLPVIAAGGALNGVTIALNGGTLPASASALRAAGFPVETGDFTNSGVLAHPVLPWLGDVFVWPAPLPLANVFSVGDVLIVLGVGYGAHRITRSRLSRRPWPPLPVATPGGLGEPADAVPTASASSVVLPGSEHVVGFAPASSLTPLQLRLARMASSEVEARRRRVSHIG